MKYINYNKWAFHFMIWIMVTSLAQFYLTINYNALTYDTVRFAEVMQYFEIIAFVLFLAIIVFLTLSIIYKKVKNYQFWLALLGAIGYLFKILLSMVVYVQF